MNHRPHRSAQLVLVRHPIVLLPGCIITGIAGAIIARVLEHMLVPSGMFVAAVCALLSALMQVMAWLNFRITISTDRIQICSWNRGMVRRMVYPIPALSTIGYEQHFLETLLNSGSLVLSTTRGQLRYAYLTPFSDIKNILG